MMPNLTPWNVHGMIYDANFPGVPGMGAAGGPQNFFVQPIVRSNAGASRLGVRAARTLFTYQEPTESHSFLTPSLCFADSSS